MATNYDTLLKSFAATKDLAKISWLVNTITPAGKLTISTTAYGMAVQAIATSPAAKDLVVSTMSTYMSKVGSLVAPADIGKAMETTSYSKNFAVLDALTDYLTPAQKAMIGSDYLGRTLNNISEHTYGNNTDAETANATRDLMTKLGQYVPAGDIGIAMVRFSYDKNFAALDAVTDYLTAGQKAEIAKMTLGVVLNNISEHTYGNNTDAETANATRDLMTKLGQYVPASDIGIAMVRFSYDKNFAALDAVTDYLTAGQKAEIAKMTLGVVLNNISEHTYGYNTNSETANVTRDFMSKLGQYVEGNDIGKAMLTFSNDKNFAALDAVTDYLTAGQKAEIAKMTLGVVLNNISEHTNGYNTNSETANVTRDFMSKLGQYVEGNDTGKAMLTFSNDKNFAALDAVTDYLTAGQKAEIAKMTLGVVLNNISEHTYGYNTNSETTNVTRDFMSKLGQYVEGNDIGKAMLTFSNDKNFAALDAVTDYLTAGQKAQIAKMTLGVVLNNISEHTFGYDTNTETANVTRDFMSKLGQYLEASDIGKAMISFSYDKNFAALDAVTDYLTVAQKGQLALSQLGHVLLSIAEDNNGEYADHIITAAISDLMTKVGQYIDVNDLASTARVLAHDGNYEGAGAIFDNVSDTTASRLYNILGGDGSFPGLRVLTNGNDTIGQNIATAGDNVIYARGGDDTVRGWTGNDHIFGGAGKDTQYGDEGNDFLYGGLGNDRLTGGVGKDTFVFQSGGGLDAITDFKASEGDRLDFSALLEGFDPLTHAITDFVVKTAVTGGTQISIDADGKGAGAAQAVVVLEGVTQINIQDLYNKGQIAA